MNYKWLWVVPGVAVLLCIFGAFVAPREFFASYLVSYLFWFGLSTGSFALLLIHRLTGGRWGDEGIPIFQAASNQVLLLAILFLPVVLGAQDIYPWMKAGAVPEHIRHSYLNLPFFALRALTYFVVLLYLVRRSAGETSEGMNGLFLIVLTLVGSFALMDWAMSLEPKWYSTVYGISHLVGFSLAAYAFMMIFVPGRNDISFRRDQANVLITLVVVWLYLNFSQYIVVWCGNIVEEASWYVSRTKTGWKWLALAIVLFHFVVPLFLLLMFRSWRPILLFTAGLLLVMRFVGLAWTVMPSVFPLSVNVSSYLLVSMIAVGCLWFLFFHRAARPYTVE